MMQLLEKKTAIIISITSDIGARIAHDWLDKGYFVIGTYRTPSNELNRLIEKGALCFYCDLLDDGSIDDAAHDIQKALKDRHWDIFLSAAGDQDPVGLFEFVNIQNWQQSIQSNFIGQMRFLHHMLPTRRTMTTNRCSVIFFAGPGTNNAPKRYSAYILSKIALIKAIELLDEEIEDAKFTIIGPGWVKTKTHETTLNKYRKESGENYMVTCQKLASKDCVPIEKVLECVNWVLGKDKKVLGGRNISLVFDKWLEDDLDDLLLDNNAIYKLRRMGNDIRPRDIPISEKGLER